MQQTLTPTRCRSPHCRAEVVWMRTRAGKFTLVDIATVDLAATGPDRDLFDPKKHTSHFATCPDAKKFRKPRTTQSPEA